jgi:hypothetical protein
MYDIPLKHFLFAANDCNVEPIRPGLPDGIFSNQKILIWVNFKCLAMTDAGKLYGHSVYFTAISYILWPFGIFCDHFGILFLLWYVVPKEKSGIPAFDDLRRPQSHFSRRSEQRKRRKKCKLL